MHRASLNHWLNEDNPVPRELKRLMELRYNFAVQHVSGVVYDAGCGHGFGTNILANSPSVTQVIARDIDDEAVAIAGTQLQSRYNVDLGVMDIEAEPIPRGVDYVVCTEVIEHLQNAGAFIRKIKRSTCAGAVLSWPLDRSVNPFHLRKFEAGEMERLMGGWDGEVRQMVQRVPTRNKLRLYELGVFHRRTRKASEVSHGTVER